jgi:YVTN family beta-propeller protein
MGGAGKWVLAVVATALCAASTAAYAEIEIRQIVQFVPPENARGPWGVDVDRSEQMVYVAGLESPYKLAVIDATTDRIVNNIQLSGLYPHAVAVFETAGRVYVTNTGTCDISVVDALMQTEIATIPVGDSPVAVCVNPSTALIYVANKYDGDVTVIDALTSTPVDTIEVGAYPYDICTNPVTNRIYVANLSDWTVSVIDGLTSQVIDTIPVGAYPAGICVNDVTNIIYVSERDDNSVAVIDGLTNRVVCRVPVGTSPRKLCADPDRNLVFVVNNGTRNIYMIDGLMATVIDSVKVGRSPVGGIAADATSDRIYVTNYESDDVSVVDGDSLKVAATVRLGWFPYETAVDGQTGKWFVTNRFGNNVACRERHSSDPVWNAAVDYSPGPVCVCSYDSPVTVDRLYVTLPDLNRVVSVEVATGSAIDTVRVDDTPQGVCFNAATDRLYVVNNGSNNVSVIAGSTGDLIDTVPLAYAPLDVGVNEVTNIVYVTTWMGMLYKVDGFTGVVLDSVELHGFCEPNHVAVNDITNKVYVGALNCNAVWIVDGSSLLTERSLLLYTVPDGIAVNRQIGHTYVCVGESLVVIEPDHAVGETVGIGMQTGGCSVDEDNALIYVGCPDAGSVVILFDHDIASIASSTGHSQLVLQEGFPNPFTAAIYIRFSVPARSRARLRIYDVRGTLVQTLFDGTGHTGSDTVCWDGKDRNGRAVAPGVYLIALDSAGGGITRRVCRLR